MGKIIMIGAMKGGVGKSVTAFNLAYSLQKKGKKVLAVDFDPQSNLTTCFGAADEVIVTVNPQLLAMKGLADFLKTVKKIKSCINEKRTNFEPPSGKRTKQNEVEWLEWQAHRLAPRVLMPKNMFRKKAEELLDNDINSCDELIHQLAEFFIVSRSSVKIRLLEVGLEERISGFQDYEAVYAELNRTKDFVPLTLEESFQMLSDNPILEEWVESYGLLFVDGYFVVPDRRISPSKTAKYIRQKGRRQIFLHVP